MLQPGTNSFRTTVPVPANHDTDLTLKMIYDNNPSNLLRRSDQWPFLQHRVPSIFFHTGLHPDYHTTGDRPERTIARSARRPIWGWAVFGPWDFHRRRLY